MCLIFVVAGLSDIATYADSSTTLASSFAIEVRSNVPWVPLAQLEETDIARIVTIERASKPAIFLRASVTQIEQGKLGCHILCLELRVIGDFSAEELRNLRVTLALAQE